jgi:hypothetical protein
MLSNAIIAALDSDLLFAEMLVEMDFADGIARVWTGSPDLVTEDGAVWLGLGELGTVEGLDQPIGTRAPLTTFVLSGIPRSRAATLRGRPQQYQRRDARLFIQLWSATGEPIGAPVLLKTVSMDNLHLSATLKEVVARLDCESLMAGRNRVPAALFAEADQKQRHPGDTFFDAADGLTGRRIPFYEPS